MRMRMILIGLGLGVLSGVAIVSAFQTDIVTGVWVLFTQLVGIPALLIEIAENHNEDLRYRTRD